jgi:hypothetical protein
MKFIWRYVWRRMKEIGNEPELERDCLPSALVGSTARRGSDIDSDEGLNITVRQALGGKIVTFRHYDHRTDRNHYKNYVIPDDHDFERELGKMITLESMRG